jgi:hypothetical protein
MKALCFIFLLPLILTAPTPNPPPHFPFQKVIFSILTEDSVLDLAFWWDIERRSLGAAFRQHQHFERVDGSFIYTLENTWTQFVRFDGPRPTIFRTQVTGRITFTPPTFPPGTLPPGTLPAASYVANPADTIRLSDANGQINIPIVIVTILAPGDRDLDDMFQAEMHRNFHNMRDIVANYPLLPGPQPQQQPLGPMEGGISGPDAFRLRYGFDVNMILHVLDGTLLEMQNEDIICAAVDSHGYLLQQRRSDILDPRTIVRSETALGTALLGLALTGTPGSLSPPTRPPFELLAYSWALVQWKLWGGLAIFNAPGTTDELEVGPIWDCEEASTSGTKDEPLPREELRRRRLFLE